MHQRKSVLPFDEAYAVEYLRSGGRDVSDDELDHLYELYLAVQARGRDLNSFPLPKSFLRDMLAHPSWELMTLTLRETGTVVAFGAHFIGARHYAPMIVGLDYDYVRSHGAYRQALRNAILRARELGSKRVLLGMGATFEKTRFGAHVQERVAFAQASDHYSAEVLAALSADTRAASGYCRAPSIRKSTSASRSGGLIRSRSPRASGAPLAAALASGAIASLT